jgi:hypothetical protein
MKTTQKNKRRESLQERVHRHLNDINSVITEDDIRNVKTELTVAGETTPDLGPKDNERKKRKTRKQKKENEIDTEEKQTTPWNILSEGYD